VTRAAHHVQGLLVTRAAHRPPPNLPPPPPPPQDTWPSLFIAPAGVGCGAHVDAFASNFWMAVLQVCAALLLCQFLCRL